ncbi:Major facilitator superfamily domain, general substrate transporter [Niveomyces insectorum RCEF 264]|uniref:Major facilitator superfamily domain, general substrate transporter n=1 Tax=Niveomyces insectorum RCEF 264 TaxID=1081102 RepID=A0A162J770_9HYPO|nr:Major facilitator superfamily domain, general substrate transporter [Niveomyces insectorum RCEF 264]
MESMNAPSGRASEATPLLAEAGDDALTESPKLVSPVFPRKNLVTVASIMGMLALFEMASALQSIPLNQVVEDIICRNIAGTGLPLGDCGENTKVQAELAFLRGWQLTLDLLPGLLTAVPYGYIADKHGRKTMLVLSVVGTMLTQLIYLTVCWRSDVLPIRMTWLSSAAMFLGGGPVVLNGIIFSILADLTPEVYRSNVFLYVGASVLLGELISSSLASTLMQTNLWLPIFIGAGLLFPVLLMSLALPETRPPVTSDLAADSFSQDNNGHASTAGGASIPNSYGESGQQKKTAWSSVRNSLKAAGTATVFLFEVNGHVTLLLITLLTSTLGRNAQEVLLQFARKQYDWTWAQAGYLVTLKSFVLLLLLLVLLPAASYAITRWTARTALQRDLWLTQMSCAGMLVGTAVIGLSRNPVTMITGVVLYCLGNGYTLLLRSLLAALVEPSHLSTLLNTAGILESLGIVVAGPLLAAAFRAGLNIHFVGLPFLVATALFALAMVVLVLVRLPTA